MKALGNKITRWLNSSFEALGYQLLYDLAEHVTYKQLNT